MNTLHYIRHILVATVIAVPLLIALPSLAVAQEEEGFAEKKHER